MNRTITFTVGHMTKEGLRCKFSPTSKGKASLPAKMSSTSSLGSVVRHLLKLGKSGSLDLCTSNRCGACIEYGP